MKKEIWNWTAYLWDCLIEMDNLIKEWVKIDLIVLDPPYEVQCNGWGTVNNIKKLNKSLNAWIVKSNLVKWYDYDWVFERLDLLQNNINIYFFCSKTQIMKYMNRYVNEKKCTFDILFWHKNNALPTYSNKYLSDCEYILHFRKWAKCKPENYKDAQTVYLSSINHKDKKIFWHPTIKPLDLVEKIIRNSSKEWDLILDCFSWSWTTWVACQNTNRKFIMIEKDENYFNVWVERINNLIP